MAESGGIEQLAERSGAALDLGRAVSGEQRVHHGDHLHALGDQARCRFRRDATDSDNRQADAGASFAQQFGIGRGCPRLCLRLEEAAEGDIAGAVTRGLFGQRQLRMAGGADDCLAAEQGTGGGQRAIFLA